jgi:hypothetical protein
LCFDVNPPSLLNAPPVIGQYAGAAASLGLVNIPMSQVIQTANTINIVDLPLASNRAIWIWVTSTGTAYTSTTYLYAQFYAINIDRPQIIS